VILDDIANYLVAYGIGAVHKGRLPDVPDQAVCLYEYGGPVPQFTHDGQAWENPRVQVVARHRDYAAARQKAQDIYMLLNGKANLLIGGSRYLQIRALQSPFPLGRDQNDRERIVINLDIAKE
jgi:Bacteriophage minor capsid protein